MGSRPIVHDGSLTKDAAYLVSCCGTGFLYAGGSTVFQVTDIIVTQGDAHITIKVVDGQGKPLKGYGVACGWPDGPHAMVGSGINFQTIPADKAEVLWTDVNGIVSFPLGPDGGLIKDAVKGGPFAICVLSDKFPSDRVTRVGHFENWRGPLQMTFKLVETVPAEPPVTPPVVVPPVVVPPTGSSDRGSMFCVHEIPTHWSGEQDAKEIDEMHPDSCKVVVVDTKLHSCLKELPLYSDIVIRLHPMSELYGQRGLSRGVHFREAPSLPLLADDNTKFEAYFAQVPWKETQETRAAIQAATLATPAKAKDVGLQHADIIYEMLNNAVKMGISADRLSFEGLNEPRLWADEAPAADADYECARLERGHSYGIAQVVGNWGVGWVGNGGVTGAKPDYSPWAAMFSAMKFDPAKPKRGDKAASHEYCAGNGPEENYLWWYGRMTQCPYQVPWLITECGIDFGVVNDYGKAWRDLAGTSFDAKADKFIGWLYWAAGKYVADGRVQGMYVFTRDIGSRDWEKFDIRCQPWFDAFVRFFKANPVIRPRALGSVVAPPVNPPPIVVPPSGATVAEMREALYGQMGQRSTFALPVYAKAHPELGVRVGPEQKVGTRTCQLYSGGKFLWFEGNDYAHINVEPL
jgi:hypothetical protein